MQTNPLKDNVQGKYINRSDVGPVTQSSNSEVTIYKDAVRFEPNLDVIVETQENTAPKGKEKRFSSSSEEINTSDEFDIENLNLNQTDQLRGGADMQTEQHTFENFVGTRLKEFREQHQRGQQQSQQRQQLRSQINRNRENEHVHDEEVHDLEQIELLATQEIRQSKAMKAHTNTIAGKVDITKKLFNANRSSGEFAHSMFVDEDYSMMGGHVDSHMKAKIINSEYVDFAKLLPHDRLYDCDEIRMELVNRNGLSYWVPAERDSGNTISSFSKWEQAFKVYSKIYAEAYPNRATELIQYNYTISSAATSFTWENVYAYDRDFRLHISRHPERSWSVLLQQAWSMRLRDRVNGFENRTTGNGNSSNNSRSNNRNICFKFNRGRCTYGMNCKFDHKCAICGKWGHGAHNCRKASGVERQQWTERNRETGEVSHYEKHGRDDRDDKRENNGGSNQHSHHKCR